MSANTLADYHKRMIIKTKDKKDRVNNRNYFIEICMNGSHFSFQYDIGIN